MDSFLYYSEKTVLKMVTKVMILMNSDLENRIQLDYIYIGYICIWAVLNRCVKQMGHLGPFFKIKIVAYLQMT